MAAAARGEGFEIGYGSTVQYDFAPDVGVAFARASAAEGAQVANFPGVAASTADVAAAIEAAVPEAAGQITWTEDRLPFPREARGDAARAPRRPTAAHLARGGRAPDGRALPPPPLRS
jgi:hypothetical protein